jgi:branched-subunit amino acid ABC-type transport system permease component
VFIFNDSVKLVWGTDLRIVKMPPQLTGSVSFLGQVLPTYYFFIIGMGLVVALSMWLILKRTKVGKLLRAAAEQGNMVGLLGYNVSAMFTVVFMVATALAGLAGVVISPTIRLALGMDILIIIECFLVVIIGGLGNVWGALLAALITGQTYAFGILVLEKYAMAFLFGLAALIIIFRPSGLLGKSGQ